MDGRAPHLVFRPERDFPAAVTSSLHLTPDLEVDPARAILRGSLEESPGMVMHPFRVSEYA